MGFLYNLGGGINQVLFIKEQLAAAHAYIDRNHLKVDKVEDDLDKQMIQLENAAGTSTFQSALQKAKSARRFVLAVAILIAIVLGGIYLIDKIHAEASLMKNTLNWVFENIGVATAILLVPFLLLIVGAQVSRSRFNKLYGKRYEDAWRAIEHKLGNA
ncbi:DUF6097 family protein [Olivibacter domesticus]|uniref:Uncharacterized protein n=1 Tax=Olivibacter domesticus TaxID=407022 RepID=A0A1H7TLN1_OLID1|nr:DUF6097 family protein [Olivibacter domesticus]SEL85603.1 hypothetical protein SAMN05661044_03584 [Olivibacter domesticus]